MVQLLREIYQKRILLFGLYYYQGHHCSSSSSSLSLDTQQHYAYLSFFFEEFWLKFNLLPRCCWLSFLEPRGTFHTARVDLFQFFILFFAGYRSHCIRAFWRIFASATIRSICRKIQNFRFSSDLLRLWGRRLWSRALGMGWIRRGGRGRRIPRSRPRYWHEVNG